MRLRALLFLCVVANASCESTPSQPTPACSFSLSATSMTMAASGGSGSVTVTAGSQCSWTARSDSAWMTATGGTSVTGSGAFTFNAAAMTDSAPRTGTLTVAGQTVTVTQQGLACAYAVQPATRTVEAAGGTAAFDVNTSPGCAWSVSGTATWLTLASGASGSGSATVTYQVAPNPDTLTRTASLTVGGQAHVVTQTGSAACSVDLSRDHDSMTVAGGTGTFDVTAPSTCAWAAASNVPWMRVTDPAGGLGTGSRRVTYVVDANPDAGSRSGVVTVAGKTFTLTQTGTAACGYAVAPVDVRACMTEGFVRTVAVTTGAGCPWTAATAASWLTITAGASGTGSGNVSYKLGSNFDAARQGIIEVRWPTPTAGQNVRVAQSGCGYGVSRDSIDVSAPGGDFFFEVISGPTDTSCGGALQDGCMWTATASASWVTVLSSMPRFGYDRVSIRVAPNGTSTARTATVTVRDKTVLIRQVGL